MTQVNNISAPSYLIGEEMLPSNQKQIIEHIKFTKVTLRKAFEKQKQLNPKKKTSWCLQNFTIFWEPIAINKNTLYQKKD